MSDRALALPARARPALVGLERAAIAALAVLAFASAMSLLQAGAAGVAEPARALLAPRSLAQLLGAGWLAAYVFLSGSPPAAALLALFHGGAIDARQCLAAVAGTRLGSIGVALLLALLYAIRAREPRVSSVTTGVLACLVTHAIGWVALLVGLLILPLELFALRLPAVLERALESGGAPVSRVVLAVVPPWGAFVAGTLLLLAAMALIDRAVPLRTSDHEAEWLAMSSRTRLLAFAAGFVVTLVTPSMTFSIGLLIPLCARGWFPESRIVPYVMGANLAAFSDTAIAALLLEDGAATNVVLTEVAAVTLVSLVVLVLLNERFERPVLRAAHAIAGRRAALVLFVAAMVVVPLALVLAR